MQTKVVVVVVNQNNYGYSSSLLNGFLLLVDYLSSAQDVVYLFILQGQEEDNQAMTESYVDQAPNVRFVLTVAVMLR